MNYLSTWFYAETKEDESFYPQVGEKPSSFSFQKAYWQCVYCFFRSTIITNGKSIKYLFFTNTDVPADVDGVNLNEFFRDNEIKVIKKELSKKTPKDWYGAWRNQFYVFDVLETLKNYSGNHLLLDSDCIISKSLDEVFSDINKFGNIAYTVEGGGTYLINGITQAQMREMYKDFFNEASDCKDLFYCGGEIIAIKSELIQQALKVFENIWEKNFIRYQNKEFKLNEEAHFLTLIYYRLGILNNIAAKYTKRLWTSKTFDNISKGDRDLTILHFPSEKLYGFTKLFRYFAKYNNISNAQMQKKIDRIMLLDQPRFVRKMSKNLTKTKFLLQKILGLTK